MDATNINPLGDGVFQVVLTYDGQTLKLTLTDNLGWTFIRFYTVNIPAIVGGNTAYIGFTGATGTYVAVQNILTWQFTSTSNRKLLWQNYATNDIAYWNFLNGQNAGGAGYWGQGVAASWKVMAYADITGDGQADLIWQNSSTGDVVYWEIKNGQPTANKGFLSQGATTWRVAAVADITGDGKADLIWQNNNSGDVYYWQMNGTTFTGTGGYLGQGLSAWRLSAVADITGDGKNDLIWQNIASGDVYYYQMNGTVKTGGDYIVHGASAWRVFAGVDIDGDGRNDLVWQNGTSGDVYYWKMNGTTFTGNGGFLSQGLAAWRAVAIQ